MTDKQIIIDGCDVSGCPHLIEDYQWWNIAGREEHDINCCALSFDEYTDFEEDDFCKENPNCYYKQLKRAEQKLEKIKEIVVTNLQCDQCSNCDGVGLGECGDTNCSYYQMDRVLEIIEE